LNALRDFNSAIKMSPKEADLNYNRELQYISEGKKSKGMEDMKEAARLGHVQAKEHIKIPGIIYEIHSFTPAFFNISTISE
jgi:hypothetical protein